MNYSIENLLELIKDKREFHWSDQESRVDLFQYNHYMKLCFILDVDEEKFLAGEDYIIECYKDPRVFDSAKTITDEFEKIHNKKVVKMYVIKLMPQEYPIRQYYSAEEYEEEVTTCFFPLIVNNKSQISIDSNTYTPRLKNVYIRKPGSLGSIYNFGNAADVYLFAQFI
jgi:hypothetical protein